jgi:hypothetical protein
MWPQPGRELREERVGGLVDEVAWPVSRKNPWVSSDEYQKLGDKNVESTVPFGGSLVLRGALLAIPSRGTLFRC